MRVLPVDADNRIAIGLIEARGLPAHARPLLPFRAVVAAAIASGTPGGANKRGVLGPGHVVLAQGERPQRDRVLRRLIRDRDHQRAVAHRPSLLFHGRASREPACGDHDHLRAVRAVAKPGSGRAIGLSALLMHFADGVYHGVRLVELHVFRAVSRKDLRLRDLMLVIQTLGIRFRNCGQMPDAMIARGQHAEGPGTEGEAVRHEIIFVPGHLFHFREIRVVHRDLRLRDLEQLRVQFRRPCRLGQSAKELLGAIARRLACTRRQRRQRLAQGDRVTALAQALDDFGLPAVILFPHLFRLEILGIRLDHHEPCYLRQVALRKGAHAVAAERITDQDIRPSDAGVVKRGMQLVRDAHARAWHGTGIAEPGPGAIVAACTGPLRDAWLDRRPRRGPVFPAGFEDDGGRAVARAVEVQSRSVAGWNDLSGACVQRVCRRGVGSVLQRPCRERGEEEDRAFRPDHACPLCSTTVLNTAWRGSFHAFAPCRSHAKARCIIRPTTQR